MKFKVFALGLLASAALSLSLAPALANGRVVNLYSSRHYGAIEKPFQKFTAETGIEVRLSQGSPQALLERLRAEGRFSPADLFLAIDAGTLALAASEGLLQPVESEILDKNIPAQFKDPDNQWFSLAIRARTLVYNTDKVKPEELSTYEALVDPKWQGRLCMRPASHIYTISLVGSLIQRLGEEEAEEVVAGWVANNPIYIDSDTRMIENVAAGACDVAVVNHYYLARLRAQNPDSVKNVDIFWVNQGEGEGGVFYNVNAVGVTKSALNVEEAIEFIEYFSSLEGQAPDETGFPGGNHEYPVNPEAEINEFVLQLGQPIFNTSFNLWEYGAFQAPALDLLERVGYSARPS
ncbi:MAG: extracellular solute-binding protein [Anaerolineae bacterium]|nr:extracellular solute-binding protein [Anaerolineae bacterium]MDW8171306.1 extracellular solute-binding protein [Anaerolineae bacterium]